VSSDLDRANVPLRRLGLAFRPRVLVIFVAWSTSHEGMLDQRLLALIPSHELDRFVGFRREGRFWNETACSGLRALSTTKGMLSRETFKSRLCSENTIMVVLLVRQGDDVAAFVV
jgi:hypothetical protein